MEDLNDRTVCADTDLRVDMERWHKNKQKDVKELFIEAADRQILYYEKVSLYYKIQCVFNIFQGWIHFELDLFWSYINKVKGKCQGYW